MGRGGRWGPPDRAASRRSPGGGHGHGGAGSARLRSADDLRDLLARIDHRPYPAYKDLRGGYQLGAVLLFVDHVQGDPFAAPSRLRVRVPRPAALDPALDGAHRGRRVTLADFLARRAAPIVARLAGERHGSGHSGEVRIDAPGAEVLERSACLVADAWAELRLSVGLPAAGRTILGREAASLLLDVLPG